MASKLLGNSFFRKKKQPLPIEVANSSTGLRINIARARDSTQLFLGDGPCSMVKFAHTGMEEAEIVDNLMAAAAGVAQRVPGKWDNIQAIHIKTHESVALPIYNSMPTYAAKPAVEERAAGPEEAATKGKKSSKKRKLSGEEQPKDVPQEAPKPKKKQKHKDTTTTTTITTAKKKKKKKKNDVEGSKDEGKQAAKNKKSKA